MPFNIAPIADAAVLATAGAVSALVTVVWRALPKILRSMEVQVNGVETTLIREAIANAATNARAKMRSDPSIRLEESIREMAKYVKDNLPETVASVGITDATLFLMCRAALTRTLVTEG